MNAVFSYTGQNAGELDARFADGIHKVPAWMTSIIGHGFFDSVENKELIVSVTFAEFQSQCLQIDAERKLREQCRRALKVEGFRGRHRANLSHRG